MDSIGNIFQQTNPYEKFVQQLVQLESQTKLKLEQQQKTHRERKDALGAVSSSISKFNSKLTELGDTGNNSFQPLKTSSSNESVVRVHAASGIDRPSTYNINVERIASRDIALAGVMTADGFELAAQGAGEVTLTIGDKTETLTVNTQKEDEGGNMVDMTNSEILNAFADQIAEHFGDHAQANVFQVNDDEVQFSIQSLITGFDNRIQFDGATGVLAEVTTGINHLVDAEQLNARFTIDGVTFERGQNNISDAITGLNFELMGESTGNVQMSVDRDLDDARSNIDGFISAFNEMNKTIRDRTFVDAENDRRGALQNMRSIRNLTLNLRQTGLLPMESAEEGQLARLSDLGIGFEKNGTMVVEDADKLTQMLGERPDEIAALFTSEDSPIAQMKAQSEAYTKANSGIIASIEDGIDQQISRLDNRIAAQDRHLERYEQQQREQFNRLQQIITQGEEQFNQLMQFQQSMWR